MTSRLRRALMLLAVASLAARAARAADDATTLFGFVRLAGGSLDAAPSFLGGGFGKLIDGGRPGDDRADAVVGEARLALAWEPTPGWRLWLHGVARHEPLTAGDVGSEAGSGLLEAFVERRAGLGNGDELVFRFGQFFLPASRENVDPLWTSPYTLSLSAMNSWIAEEIRPLGLDLSWRRTFANQHRLELAATLFGGNDSAGTLVAWRGLALHDRPTPTGRYVQLPPFAARTTQFADQSAQGSRPFGGDLDGRLGWAGRARWSAPGGRAVLQATIFRNEGDRALHGREYAWDTDFRWLGGDVELIPGLKLVSEWGTGTSAMGFAPPGGRSPAQVDVLYDLFYALATYERGRLRGTLRFDDFRVADRDSNPFDDNRESGQAWTLALLVRLGGSWRAGVEYLTLDAQRPVAAVPGAPALAADAWRLELRYAWF